MHQPNRRGVQFTNRTWAYDFIVSVGGVYGRVCRAYICYFVKVFARYILKYNARRSHALRLLLSL